MLPFNIGTPNNGGAVVTAGGVVFIAAATDNLIRAIDVETGATLWQDVLPAGGQANPMVYEIGGRQYLVIMCGRRSRELVAYCWTLVRRRRRAPPYPSESVFTRET